MTSWDVNAPVFRSFRNVSISASTLLWSFPPSNFIFVMGMVGSPALFGVHVERELGSVFRFFFYTKLMSTLKLNLMA